MAAMVDDADGPARRWSTAVAAVAASKIQAVMRFKAGADGVRALHAAFREEMRSAGVDQRYLGDEHWARGWGKHFEHLPCDGAIPRAFGAARSLRVMQWNLLAEGLTPDGFLMPLVSAEHVARFEAFLADLVSTDVARAADLYARGHRNVIWEEGSRDYVAFASMAAETMTRMKKCAGKDEKNAVGLELKAKYSPASTSDDGSGQMSVNEAAVTSVGHRLLRARPRDKNFKQKLQTSNKNFQLRRATASTRARRFERHGCVQRWPERRRGRARVLLSSALRNPAVPLRRRALVRRRRRAGRLLRAGVRQL
jgi:hypothetical protein